MILCAGKMESFDFAKSIGVGLIDAAINTTRLAMLNKPKSLLFVGTCGSYGQHKIGEIIKTSSAANVENSFFASGSYTPIDSVISQETGENSTIVNSSNFITTDEDLWQSYNQHKITAENMEFFSVMKVAQSFLIPAAGIFYVSNYCNKDAHKDFVANLPKALQTLREIVKENA
ncbi:MAG: phosphorylase family protein [Helicobacteraceae bacterium]